MPALVLVVFLAAFVPRAVYPVSRPTQWYVRSVMFVDSLLRGTWEELAYSEHPGVTTMWLSGAALRVAGVAPELRPEGPYVDPNGLTARESAIGVWPLALAIAATIVLDFLLLGRLFDRVTALAAALLVALDPFFIANSKVLHVDGLLTAAMVSSALALLVFASEGWLGWAVLSGALAGLALLTKSPALFLFPYAALCLAVGIAIPTLPHTQVQDPPLRRALRAGLVWLAALVLVYVLLFPGMWADPLGTLRSVYSKAALRVSWAHPNPIYFLGQSSVGDPGPAYYVVTLVYKLTSVVSVFALAALVLAAWGRDVSRRQRVLVALTLAYACFFTLQMTLGAKKQVPYLLPAFPMVDVLAGVGIVWWARRVGRLWGGSRERTMHGLSTALVALPLIVQAALVLPRHPYYDTYFSELAGGAQAGVAALSTQWQGEGLDLAARQLNLLPDAEHQTVGSHKDVMLRQYFVGETVDVDAEAGWYALGISNVLEGGEDKENRLVDRYLRREAWDTIEFDGIPYVQVYPAATGPQNPVRFTFERGIQLIGYDLPSSPLHPGETLKLQLYWRALEPLAEDYNVFVHLLTGAAADQLIVQQDNPPKQGKKPTSTWKAGKDVRDPYDLLIPDDAPAGEHTVAVGLYHWPDLTRLPVRDDAGVQLPDQRILLTKVRVERDPFPAPVWVARGVAAVVLLSTVAGPSRAAFHSRRGGVADG